MLNMFDNNLATARIIYGNYKLFHEFRNNIQSLILTLHEGYELIIDHDLSRELKQNFEGVELIQSQKLLHE
jgi:hypothetical protein